jgi:hypothetical protein
MHRLTTTVIPFIFGGFIVSGPAANPTTGKVNDRIHAGSSYSILLNTIKITIQPGWEIFPGGSNQYSTVHR